MHYSRDGSPDKEQLSRLRETKKICCWHGNRLKMSPPPFPPLHSCLSFSCSLCGIAEIWQDGKQLASLSLSHSPCSPNIPSVRYPLIGKAQHRHFLRAFITGTTPCDVRLLSTPVIKSPQSDGQDSVTGLLSYLMEKAVRHRRPLLGSWPLLSRLRRQKRTKKKNISFFSSFYLI